MKKILMVSAALFLVSTFSFAGGKECSKKTKSSCEKVKSCEKKSDKTKETAKTETKTTPKQNP